MAAQPRATHTNVLILLGFLAAAALAACGGKGLDYPEYEYVQFVNGFDFPVKANVTDASGSTQTFDIPAKGRVGKELGGKHTVELLTPDGKSMDKRKYDFATGDKRKEHCLEVVNVLGAAAILEEDVVYGMGVKGNGKLTSGHRYTKMCPRWGFETTAPPEAITVKEDTYGMNLTWMHYAGEGDWHASIERLLAHKPQLGDQSRIRAWNIAVAVQKYDPDNPRFAPLGAKFKAACDKIEDMFTSGPLAGKAQADCHASTRAMFPDA